MSYPWDDYEWPEPRQTFFGDPRIMDMAQSQLTGPESFPVVPPPMAFPPGPDRSGPSPWRIALAESLRDRPIQPGGDAPLLAFLSGALSRGGDVFSRRTLADYDRSTRNPDNRASLARLNAANATAAGQIGTARLAGLKSISGAMKAREEARAKAEAEKARLAGKDRPYDPNADPEILRDEERRKRGLGVYRAKAGGPPQIIQNDDGTFTVVPQDGKLPTATERAELAKDATAMDQVRAIKGLFRPEYVGPSSILRDAASKFRDGALLPGEGDFKGALAIYRNAVINALSGAAVSAAEAKRMEQQIPNAADPPERFKAKMRQTEENVRRVARNRRDVYMRTGVNISGLSPLPEPSTEDGGWEMRDGIRVRAR